MDATLERYGTGSGIPLGVGVGSVAALLAGLGSDIAVVAAFGASGGLVVGGFAGRYAEEHLGEENWAYRVAAFTLLVSLLVGGLLGALTAWMVVEPLWVGFLAGSAAGGAFSLLVSSTLVSKGRSLRSSRPTA
jgi:hypothetical protein